MPLASAVASRPSTIGSIRSPEAVADTPFTYCRNVGMKVIEPIIAKPTMKLSTEHTLNTRLRNSRIGRMGSAARSSTSTKMASAATDADEQADDRGASPRRTGCRPRTWPGSGRWRRAPRTGSPGSR